MTEYTREQFEAIDATETALVAAVREVATLSGDPLLSWETACLLVGRDIDELTIGELRRIVKEVGQ